MRLWLWVLQYSLHKTSRHFVVSHGHMRVCDSFKETLLAGSLADLWRCPLDYEYKAAAGTLLLPAS